MKKNNQDKVTILTEGTPNPNAIKFVLNKSILENKTANFPSREKANNSPLAKKLFGIKEVREVFIGKDGKIYYPLFSLWLKKKLHLKY